LQRAATNPATRAADPTADQIRRQVNRDIARERDQAHSRWLLLGGSVNR
jgi:hypothetical protein